MRPHAAVLRGQRRPRRFRREIARLHRAHGRAVFSGRPPYYDGLVNEFKPDILDYLDYMRVRAERLAAIDALFGEWEVHV